MPEASSATGEVEWTPVERLAPTPEQLARRRRRRARETFGFYLYALAVAIPFAVVVRLDRDLSALLGLIVLLAGIGALQFVRFRSLVARDADADQRAGLRRVGATDHRLILEGDATIELAWEQVEPPTLDRREFAWRFRLPYRTVDGEALDVRLGPAEVAAILKLRQRPEWSVTPSLLEAVAAEYEVRGLPAPELTRPL